MNLQDRGKITVNWESYLLVCSKTRKQPISQLTYFADGQFMPTGNPRNTKTRRLGFESRQTSQTNFFFIDNFLECLSFRVGLAATEAAAIAFKRRRQKTLCPILVRIQEKKFKIGRSRLTWNDSALQRRLSLEPLVTGGRVEAELDGEEVEMLLAVVWVWLECSARLSEVSDSSEESSLESSCDRLGTKILRFDPATKGPLDMLGPCC